MGFFCLVPVPLKPRIQSHHCVSCDFTGKIYFSTFALHCCIPVALNFLRKSFLSRKMRIALSRVSRDAFVSFLGSEIKFSRLNVHLNEHRRLYTSLAYVTFIPFNAVYRRGFVVDVDFPWDRTLN